LLRALAAIAEGMLVGKDVEVGRPPEGEQKRAAEYVRMSTDHQRYSTENQGVVIRKYALARGFQIVRTYADEGKSGLNLGGRDALQRLLDDVQARRADFCAVLVYDISRWGRFQDADESAFHEYVCKRAGVAVHFCAEQFENDGGLAATMLKGIKRVMAGEYSRELSTKVFIGQCRLIELGFRQGGIAGYGLRRLLVDEHRNSKGQLAPGEHKSIQTDRVVLVPGPPDEVAIVRRIYSMFLDEGRSETLIANELNAEGVGNGRGTPWTRSMVSGILTNDKYVGDNVFNRNSFKLKQQRVANSRAMWIRAEAAFDALVDRGSFDAVRRIIEARCIRASDDEMLDALRNLLRERGSLSAFVIDEAPGVPSSSAYRQRFGSLGRVYRMIGTSPTRDDAYVEINRALRAMFPSIVAQTVDAIERVGGSVQRGNRDGLLLVNQELSINLIIARCVESPAAALQWTVRLDPGARTDLTVAVRMERGNTVIRDYYLLPRIGLSEPLVRLAEENGVFLDAFRFDDLHYLSEMTARSPVRRAA
jgi:DNA invertase Pin-like site-specific DNA recombinase